MDDLITAFTIFRKYSDVRHPTHCEHDVLHVCINPSTVSDEDKAKLKDLGFLANEQDENFYSYRFGSC